MKCREYARIQFRGSRAAKGRKQVERNLAGTEQAGAGAVTNDDAISEHQVPVLAFQQVAFFRQHADEHDLDAVPAMHSQHVIRARVREGVEVTRARDHRALGKIHPAYCLPAVYFFEAYVAVRSASKINDGSLDVPPLVLNRFWPDVLLRARRCCGGCGQVERNVELVVHMIQQRRMRHRVL